MSARARPLLVATVLIAGACCALYLAGSLAPLEQATVDTRFQLRGEQDPPEDLVLALIDEQTLRRTGVTGSQIPRRWHREALERLNAEDVGLVVYDLLFEVPSADLASKGDIAFSYAIKASKAPVIQVCGQR